MCEGWGAHMPLVLSVQYEVRGSMPRGHRLSLTCRGGGSWVDGGGRREVSMCTFV